MNADPLTYAPFLLLLLLGALVEIRYWIRNRARMTPKARLRRGLFLAAVPVLCAALWLGWERAAFWLEEHSAPPYAQIEVPVSDLRDNQDGLRTFTERLWETVRSGTHAEALLPRPVRAVLRLGGKGHRGRAAQHARRQDRRGDGPVPYRAGERTFRAVRHS